MNRLCLLLLVLITCYSASFANSKSTKVQWLSFEEVEALMKTKPKKVLIDVYTNWCTWCKRMDKEIYNNEQAAAYINEYYYAVKFNAETKEEVVFMGETFVYDKRYKMNRLALKLCNYEPTFPTTVLMNTSFSKSVPFGGYLEIYQMESILKYYATNAFESQSWADWNRAFIMEWQTSGDKKK